jgi:signal peptide peptidase SppA
MFNDLHWSIYPGAEKDVLARVAAYAQHCIKHGVNAGGVWIDTDAGPVDLSKLKSDNWVNAGPALDAERDALPIQVANGTAIVDLKGLMVRSAGMFAHFFGITGSDQVRQSIQAADADPDITEIVLRVDSPGGSVSGMAELGDAVKATDKPIVTQVEGVAASAAFYVAALTDKITVGRTDLVGSIGTRMLLFDFSKAFREAGIEAVVIDSGEFKSTGAPGTEITDRQRADLQRIVDFHFDDFVAQVVEGRGMTEKAVRAIADGRMFTPPEAIANGLIDGVSTFEQVMSGFHTKTQRLTSASRARLAL